MTTPKEAVVTRSRLQDGRMQLKGPVDAWLTDRRTPGYGTYLNSRPFSPADLDALTEASALGLMLFPADAAGQRTPFQRVEAETLTKAEALPEAEAHAAGR